MEPSDFGTPMIIQLKLDVWMPKLKSLEFIQNALFSPMKLFFQDGPTAK
jgi:hypothetical protein